MKGIWAALIVLVILLALIMALYLAHSNRIIGKSRTGGQNLSSYIGGRNYTLNLSSGGMERTYIIHFPIAYGNMQTYPLVIALHGGEGTDSRFLNTTGFTQESDSKGFIVIFPQGVDNTWADARGTTDASKIGVNDIAFIQSLINYSVENFDVDSKEVYVTGFSDGGFMAITLACAIPNEIAAVAPVAAGQPENLTICNRQVPFLLIHGSADPYVPANGGHVIGTNGGGYTLSSNQTVQFWANINGCSKTTSTQTLPIVVQDNTSVTETTYNDCYASTVFYDVIGGGHAWPGGQYKQYSIGPVAQGTISGNINATQVIWQFFSSQSLGKA